MNDMEQFSLDEHLKNPDRKIVTRDGHLVRIICTDRNDPNPPQHPIVALVLRYRDKINIKTVNQDAQEFLNNCSYTGLKGCYKNK